MDHSYRQVTVWRSVAVELNRLRRVWLDEMTFTASVLIGDEESVLQKYLHAKSRWYDARLYCALPVSHK